MINKKNQVFLIALYIIFYIFILSIIDFYLLWYIMPSYDEYLFKPNQTKPNQTKPNQTKPNQTKPNQTKPNQTKQNRIEYFCIFFWELNNVI